MSPGAPLTYPDPMYLAAQLLPQFVLPVGLTLLLALADLALLLQTETALPEP